MRRTKEKASPMSNEGRNAYVVTHLTEAFLSLLEEKTIDSITISELVDKAEVGRASFYRNFENKENILKAHIDILLREWTENYANQTNVPLSEQMRAMISHFEKHRSFYGLLNERGLIYLLKDVIIGIFGRKQDYEKAQAYATAFVAYALYGWIDIWFQRGMNETSDEVCEMFKQQGL